VILTALLLGLLGSQPIGARDSILSHDPSLAEKATLRLKNMPIKEALASLEATKGPELSCAPNIDNLKITIFVESEPRWKILDQAANVLGCSWEKQKGRYLMTMPRETRNEIRTYLDAESTLLQQRAQSDIADILKATAEPTKDLEKRLKELNASGKPYKESAQERQALLTALDSRYRQIADMIRRQSPSDSAALWQGRTWLSEPIAAKQGPTTWQMAVRFNPNLDQLVVKSTNHSSGFLMGLELILSSIPFYKSPIELKTQTLAKDLLAWSTPEAKLDGDESLKAPIPQSQPTESPYDGKVRTLADVLEVLFDRSKRPIVADGSRAVVETASFPYANVREWLKEMDRYFPVFVRTEGDWLLLRHGGYWRRRLFELPEGPLAKLEEKRAKGRLHLGDYAEFASSLDDSQALAFITLPRQATKFDQTPLRDAMPALRFLGSLSEGQRQASLRGPLPFAGLIGRQRTLFLQALAESPFMGGDQQSWQSALMSGRLPQRLVARLAFSLAAARVWPGGRPHPGGSNVNGSPGQSAEDQKVEGALFTFGVDPDHRIAFTATSPAK
jgi:hypothetical protein